MRETNQEVFKKLKKLSSIIPYLSQTKGNNSSFYHDVADPYGIYRHQLRTYASLARSHPYGWRSRLCAQKLLFYAGFDASRVNYMTFPATIGEFWMIGYLLIYGIRAEQTE